MSLPISTHALARILYPEPGQDKVNFNNIATMTLAIKKGLPALLYKGEMRDVLLNVIEMNKGNVEAVVEKRGTTYFIDPRLAVAFVRYNRPDLIEFLKPFEVRLGRADMPMELITGAPTLFHHIMRVFKGDIFRCAYRGDKWLYSLNDIIRVATEDRDECVGRVIEKDPILGREITSYTSG